MWRHCGRCLWCVCIEAKVAHMEVHRMQHVYYLYNIFLVLLLVKTNMWEITEIPLCTQGQNVQVSRAFGHKRDNLFRRVGLAYDIYICVEDSFSVY